MRYKIKTKGGRVYRSKSFDVAMGFVTLKVWDGEIKLPAGEILWVKKTYFTTADTKVENFTEQPKPSTLGAFDGCVVPILLFVLVFVFLFLILLA